MLFLPEAARNGAGGRPASGGLRLVNNPSETGQPQPSFASWRYGGRRCKNGWRTGTWRAFVPKNANMPGDFKHDLTRAPWRMMRFAGRWRLAVLGLALAGAARADEAPAVRPPPEFRQIAPLPGIREAARAGWVQLDGLAAPASREKVLPGDAVTFLVSLSRGEEVRQWMIELQAEVPTAEEDGKRPKSIHVFSTTDHEFRLEGGRAAILIRLIGPLGPADAGRKAATEPDIRRQRVLVSADYLGLGLDRVPATFLRVRALRAANPALPRGGISFNEQRFPAEVIEAGKKSAATIGLTLDDERALFGSFLALQEFLQLVSRTPGLQEILMSVLDIPWWSIIRSGGQLNLNLETLPLERELDPRPWGLPATVKVYAWPLRLMIDGKPALLFQLAVVASKPPFSVSAGIIGLAAGSPDGKGPVLTFQAVASHVAKVPPKP
jgi:hypothetical protein